MTFLLRSFLLRSFAACCLAALASSVSAQVLRAAHAESFPPYAEARAGKSEGLAVEILREAASRAGLELQLVVVPFEQLQRTLEDGRADGIFPTGDTPERRKVFDFSAPLLATGGSLYVRAPGQAPSDLASFAGKTVVTPRTGPLAAYIEKNAPEVKVVRTASYEESLQQLVEGKVDAAALNSHVGGQIAAKLYPGRVSAAPRMFLEVPLGVAVPRGKQAETLKRLNDALSAMRADGSWERINQRFMSR